MSRIHLSDRADRVVTLLAGSSWVKTLLVAVSIAVISLHWVNTRVAILRVIQDPSHPIVPSTYYIFHAMALGLRDGRFGQLDLNALQRYQALHDPWAPFERLPADGPHAWVSYYSLDIGYSFIVEAARLAFTSLPDNHLRPLALQLLADAATVFFVFFLFSEWSVVLGFAAAYLYTSNYVFQSLLAFPFYYYWDIPFTFVVLGALLLAYRHPPNARLWMMLAGLVLGAGVWLRGSWWPIGMFLCAVAWFTPALRKHLVLPVVVFAVAAAPLIARSSLARGHLTLSTRSIWHVALVGLGYYPNPYGLVAKDEVIFKLTEDKYGVKFRTEDYWLHDQAAKTEFFSILRKDPGFVIGSIAGRLAGSVRGNTTVLSYVTVSNEAYRIFCVIGLAAMLWRGADRRFLGIATAGVYLIYVCLTCLFYFVGLAYDNVAQVALFVSFMGGLDSVLHVVRRVPLLRSVV
jgi:hypothetical protein